MIKSLNAFDMDGTLLATYMPEEGKPIWKKHYGIDYPHLGWWGRPESLDLNVFDIKPFPAVLNQLKDQQSKPNSYVIVLTSRQEKLRPYVLAVLNKNNIHVDKLDMKSDHKTKAQKILNYVNQFPELEEINVYDDMQEHIDAYKSIRNQIPTNIKFNIYLADNGKLSLVESTSKLLSIINEEIIKYF